MSILSGCTISGPSAATSAPTPAPTSTVRSTPSTSPTLPPGPSEPVVRQTVDPDADDWATQEEAAAAVTMFLEQLAAADRYQIDRREQLILGDGSIYTVFTTVVDEAAALVSSSQTYEVSDESMWSQLTADPDEFDVYRDWDLDILVDYSKTKPRMLMTYAGDANWAGKWLDASAGTAGAAGRALRQSTPETYASGFVSVASLEPAEFSTDDGGYFEYSLPADIAATLIPAGTLLALTQAGVDVAALPGTAPARVWPIRGGMGMDSDVAYLLREAVPQLDDSPLGQAMNSIDLVVTVMVRSLNNVAGIVMPDPADIVTEAPLAPLDS